MDIDLLIKKIISFPVEFNNQGDISIYSFLKTIGYFQNLGQVNEEDIAKALIKYPEYIDPWLVWSENKRISSGWYFKKMDEYFLVGYYPKNDKYPQMSYTGITNACAAFIKREIEKVRP